jgi:predicted transcriptional regulator
MVGRPLKINWDASADLYWQAKRASKRKGKRRSMRRRILTAPLRECVRQVVEHPPDERQQYSIKVSAKAGVGKTHLDYLDTQALAWRVDYPE